MRLFVFASIVPLIVSSQNSYEYSLKTSCEEGFERNSRHIRLKRENSLTPKEHLDLEIDYLIGKLPDLIDKAVDVTSRAEAFVVLKRVTQGLSIIAGSWKQIYADFVVNNRSLGNFGGMTTIWNYGFYGFFGVGFGSPLLFGLPDIDLGCDSRDFFNLLQIYGLSNGLDDLIEAGLNGSSISSIVGEFDLLVRVELECILDFEGEQKLAEEVLFALDELNEAMLARINIIFEEESEEFDDSNTTDPSTGNNRRLSNEIRPRGKPLFQKASQRLRKLPKKNRRRGHDLSEYLTKFSF